MKLAILDDWFNTLRGLTCFSKLNGIEVTVFTDHETDISKLAKRLRPFDALVLFRERTAITAELLDQLPNLKLISQRSVYPHVDVEACSRNGVLLCSNMHSDAPSFAAAEHTWALIMASMRQIPQQMVSLQAGHWQMGVGKTLHGRRLGLYGYGRIGKTVAGYAEAFGMDVVWWGSETGRKRAKLNGQKSGAHAFRVFCKRRCDFCTCASKTRNAWINYHNGFCINAPRCAFRKYIPCGAYRTRRSFGGVKCRRPGRAAIDVFDQEPITWPADLGTHPNLICTPHIGFVTEDEFELQFSDIFDQVIAFQAGAPINMINAQLWRA